MDSTTVLPSVSTVSLEVVNDLNSVKVDNMHDSTSTQEASDFGILTTNSTLILDEVTEINEELSGLPGKLEHSEPGDLDENEFVLEE